MATVQASHRLPWPGFYRLDEDSSRSAGTCHPGSVCCGQRRQRSLQGRCNGFQPPLLAIFPADEDEAEGSAMGSIELENSVMGVMEGSAVGSIEPRQSMIGVMAAATVATVVEEARPGS